MAKEQGLFTVAEDDQEKEMIVVAEGEMWNDDKKREVLRPDDKTDRRPSPPPLRPPAPANPTNTPRATTLPSGGVGNVTEVAEDGWRNTKDVKQFTQFLLDEINRIGNPNAWRTKTEKERGLAQLKKLDHYVSQALREDYDSYLDLKSIDNVRNTIEKNIDDTEYAMDGMTHMKRERKKMRRRRGEDEGVDLVKEAQTPHFNGMQIHISAFERAIVGALMNGRASGGRDIEELYTEAKSRYNINDREELAIFQILTDMGLPTFKDRLRIGKSSDPTRTEGFGEWQSQYYA